VASVWLVSGFPPRGFSEWVPGKWLATVSGLLTLLALIVEIRRCIHDASHLLTLLTQITLLNLLNLLKLLNLLTLHHHTSPYLIYIHTHVLKHV
jgi:hypothetical protein